MAVHILCGAVETWYLKQSLPRVAAEIREMSERFAGAMAGGEIENLVELGYIHVRRIKMPIFEYECRDCGSKFEKISHGSNAEIQCKKCSSPRVEKLLSVFAVSGTHEKPCEETGSCPCGAARRGMCCE